MSEAEAQTDVQASLAPAPGSRSPEQESRAFSFLLCNH